MRTHETGMLKRWSYLVFLLPALLPLLSYRLGRDLGGANLAVWLTPAFVFLLIPLLDFCLGEDRKNPDERNLRALSSQPYYRLLTLSCGLIVPGLLIWGAAVFSQWQALTPVGRLGWGIAVGIVSGVLAINVAHELIHRDSRLERLTGGFLLSLVCYAGFKIEHIRGHHVHVATPRDASSARYDQSLYAFLPRAVVRNVGNAWRLEAERLRRLGRPAFSRHNELLGWYTVTLLAALGLTLVFGLAGLVFFLLQSTVAVALLETINYLEHYGLERRRLPDGRYERTTHLHSWNSSYLLTNLLLFQLQRHSDHHQAPWRRYQTLRHFDDSPQLPAGYATMVLLALFPPLWRRVMNPRVQAFRGTRRPQSRR